jgi:hypothetical protein
VFDSRIGRAKLNESNKGEGLVGWQFDRRRRQRFNLLPFCVVPLQEFDIV